MNWRRRTNSKFYYLEICLNSTFHTGILKMLMYTNFHKSKINYQRENLWPWFSDTYFSTFKKILENALFSSQVSLRLKKCSEAETGWDLGPGTLCCSACTWTNFSWSNNTQRNYKGLKITVCMSRWGKLWTVRYKKTKKPNCHFWRSWSKNGMGRKSRVLHMAPALNTTIRVGKIPKPPLWLDPWTCPYPHLV